MPTESEKSSIMGNDNPPRYLEKLSASKLLNEDAMKRILPESEHYFEILMAAGRLTPSDTNLKIESHLQSMIKELPNLDAWMKLSERAKAVDKETHSHS